VQTNFYQPLISPNFYDQIKNNNTNTYFTQKFSLKKIMPRVFKFSHFSPPVIYDSKWKPKNLDNEKNEVYNNYQQREQEKIEKEKDIINYSFNNEPKNANKSTEIKKIENKNEKNVFRNKQISKILEEVSTSKSFNNSLNNLNAGNKNKKNKFRNQKSKDSTNFPFNINNNTVVAGKYHLSLKKITKELSKMENHDPLNLNIVRKFVNDKGTIVSTSINNTSNINNYLYSSSSSNSVLPPIQLYKQRHFVNPFKRKENSSAVFISPKMNKFDSKGKNGKGKIMCDDEVKKKDKLEISQAVKDFYKRQKELGYSSFVNKNNNKYYKLGKSCFLK
jgi:hypothetical protein